MAPRGRVHRGEVGWLPEPQLAEQAVLGVAVLESMAVQGWAPVMPHAKLAVEPSAASSCSGWGNGGTAAEGLSGSGDMATAGLLAGSGVGDAAALGLSAAADGCSGSGEAAAAGLLAGCGDDEAAGLSAAGAGCSGSGDAAAAGLLAGSGSGDVGPDGLLAGSGSGEEGADVGLPAVEVGC